MSAGQFINQHSFTIGAVFAVALLAIWLLRDGVTLNDLLAIGALVIGLGIAYYFFNPGESTHSDSEQVLDEIGAGSPVLLEFQSPY